MNDRFLQYTVDYISGVMSLRKPQKKSLQILDDILQTVPLKKRIDKKEALLSVNGKYPTCTDFERNFISMTFALATGVGKTRLMGAFITYLYTQKNIEDFFVVAPSTTIYKKLMQDLGDFNSPKYVFKGLGCFSDYPKVISEESYEEMTGSILKGDIRIFIFNIDKFNKEDVNMKKINEFLGSTFYQYISTLPDLVLLMDESHHYRADSGMAAINGLNPVLGLELTATPLFKNGNTQEKFKNVVFEYPLSNAIADGYTRTPYALTRSDINFLNFGDEQTDKLMLADGIMWHEKVKAKLEEYANNNKSKPKVKPFMLIVCKDTNHAKWVENYVKSDGFENGNYKNKTIIVHSKQRGSESEANTKMLLEIESPDNPVEIVIHVNMLKEGWDVNNLYTIVPLRTASSKILREQMVGRGLRLPYGERVGEKIIDSVMLTAHDKFKELLDEAQKGDSIFKAGNIIKAEDLQKEKIIFTQQRLPVDDDESLQQAYKESNLEKSEANDKYLKKADNLIKHKISDTIQTTKKHTVTDTQKEEIAKEVKEELAVDMDLAEAKLIEEAPLLHYLKQRTEQIHRQTVNKYIPIPKIKITDEGVEEYEFLDFDIDLSDFNHVPIADEILIQNLENMYDNDRIKGTYIDISNFEPQKAILEHLREKPEIDYEKCSAQLYKHIKAVCDHYEEKYGHRGMQNVIFTNKRSIANQIYDQMIKHFYYKNGFLKEEVIGTRDYNIRPSYSFSERVGLYSAYTEKIQSVLFDGIKKGVFSEAKFHSDPELIFARVIESDNDVKNWLRPAPAEFDITYNHGKGYEPDFVVETDDIIFLVEVKREDQLKDSDVIAKKERAIQYCSAASRWGKANGYKNWQYLFIPSKQVTPSSSFKHLSERFKEL